MDNNTFRIISGIVTFKAGYNEKMVAAWSTEQFYRQLVDFKKEAIARNDFALRDAADRYQDILLERI